MERGKLKQVLPPPLTIFKNQQELDNRFEHLQAAKFADTLKTEHGYPDIETVTLDDGDEVRTLAMAIGNYDTFGLRELASAMPESTMT